MNDEIRTWRPPDRNPRPPSFAPLTDAFDTHVQFFNSHDPTLEFGATTRLTQTWSTLTTFTTNWASAGSYLRNRLSKPTDDSAILDSRRTLNMAALNERTQDRAQAIVALSDRV